MKKLFKDAILFVLILIIAFYAFGYFSSFIGWYGYKKWEYRKHSISINESIKRGVFVKKL